MRIAGRKSPKTNAMRVLDAAKISYVAYSFETDRALSGVSVADVLNINPERMFKTLVTEGRSKEHYVFMIPVADELDLKKAALAVEEKSITLVKSKELRALTGYVHGGCSPIGMKRFFTTVIDEAAELHDSIVFSGGHVGVQVDLALKDLREIIELLTADLTVTATTSA